MGKTGDLEKDWYLLKNGMLMYSQNKDSDEELKKYANNVVNLSQFAEDHGMKFLYLELPYKVQRDGEYPAGVRTTGNRNADGIMKILLSNPCKQWIFGI